MTRKLLSETEKRENIIKSRKKSDEKRKRFAVVYNLDQAAKIEAHYKQKGFTSANSYLKHLILEDMNNNNSDEGKV